MYNGFDPNSQNNDFYNKRVQLDGFNTITIKGQLISNGLLGIFNSSKSEKNKKKIILTVCIPMIPQVDLFSFVFWMN